MGHDSERLAPAKPDRPGFRQICVLGLLLLAAITACGRAGEPPRPERTLVPDAVSIADHWDFGSCGHLLVTLQSGEVLDVARRGITHGNCPEETPTPIILGNDQWLTYGSTQDKRWADPESPESGRGPLILIGSDDGETWLGVIRSWYGDCWDYNLGDHEGAHLEGDTLHFTSGLVLQLADDFVAPTSPPDPFPLRSGDRVCVDDTGRVTEVTIWFPY